MADRPILHSRDHSHGGPDPVRITWETVASGGGSSIATNAGQYTGSATTSGGLHVFPWTHSAGNTPIDLTDSYYPTVYTSGVYAFAAQVVWAGTLPGIGDTYAGPVSFQAGLGLDPGSLGVAEAGVEELVWQVDTGLGRAVTANLCCSWYIPVGATVSVNVTAPDIYTFDFAVFVQQVA